MDCGKASAERLLRRPERTERSGSVASDTLARGAEARMPLAFARRSTLAVLAIALALAARPALAQTDPPPPIQREFRGAWVATVANIDWPSRPGLSSWEQQAELIAILNRCVALNLNAVMLQVRPAADAFY